jgi:hypothetical protein
MGGTTADRNNDGRADNIMHLEATIDQSGSIEYEYVIPDLMPAFDMFAVLNDPAAIVNGLNTMFDAFKDALESQFAGLIIPVLGDELKQAANFIDDGDESSGDDLRDLVVGLNTKEDGEGIYTSGIGKLLKVGVQELDLNGATAGSFILQLGDQDTAVIHLGDTDVDTALAIQGALRLFTDRKKTDGSKLADVTVEVSTPGVFDIVIGAGYSTLKVESSLNGGTDAAVVSKKTTLDIIREALFSILGPQSESNRRL